MESTVWEPVITRDAVWIVNSGNDKNAFQKNSLQAVYDQEEEQIVPAPAPLYVI